MVYSLPQSALDIIDAYWKLKAGEHTYVRCPYFRNPKSGRERWGLAAYSGKGSPREIEEELKIIEKLEGKDFSTMREDEIRDIMKKRKLGIECSGFITRVLDGWTREFYKKPVHSLIKFDARGISWVFCKLRPYTHIDIPTLVHPENARLITDARDIMPGDIIRFNGQIDHAVIVMQVSRDESLNLQRFSYVHSVREDTNEGVKRGIVEFVIPDTNDLARQQWSEDPYTRHVILEKGKPHIYRLSIIERAQPRLAVEARRAKLWQTC